MATTKKTAGKKTAASGPGFTAAEKAAMKERAEELKNSGRGGAKKAVEAQALLDKIAEMSQPDKGLAERIHVLITSTAPELETKTWYGMPAYTKDGKVLCFFKPAEKFGGRYATLGFSDVAQLDDGHLWATEFAVTEIGAAEEKKLVALVKRAVG